MCIAIEANNLQLVEMLITNKNKGLDKKVKDAKGKTAVHYVVNPCKFGSYENTKLLQALANADYPLNINDTYGNAPIDYAMRQKSGKLVNHLSNLIKNSEYIKEFNLLKEKKKTYDWKMSTIDYEEDAQKLMKLAEENEDQLAEKKKNLVPVDSTGQFQKSYEVFVEDKSPWDAYMTKVDLRNGIYGDYVFYKMQLLYDNIRDLYVVFTRYGRIGEDGMNQRTPFNNIDEAKKEFCTIFK